MKIRFSVIGTIAIIAIIVFMMLGLGLILGGIGYLKLEEHRDLYEGERALAGIFGTIIFGISVIGLPLIIKDEIRTGMIECDPGELERSRLRKEANDLFNEFMKEKFKDLAD